MRRRARIVLIAAASFVTLATAAGLVLRHYAQPQQLSRLLVGFVRDELGLELTFAGKPRYAFLPGLALELDDVELVMPGATRLLSVAHVNLALPWSSLRADVLRVDSLELTRPLLDLDALSAWLAASKSGPTPAITLHLRVRDGTLRRGGNDLAGGVALDGDLDLAAIDVWLKQLDTATSLADLLPPGAVAAKIATLELDGATLHGLRIDTEAAPEPMR